jgi:hypothetical protein
MNTLIEIAAYHRDKTTSLLEVENNRRQMAVLCDAPNIARIHSKIADDMRSQASNHERFAAFLLSLNDKLSALESHGEEAA